MPVSLLEPPLAPPTQTETLDRFVNGLNISPPRIRGDAHVYLGFNPNPPPEKISALERYVEREGLTHIVGIYEFKETLEAYGNLKAVIIPFRRIRSYADDLSSFHESEEVRNVYLDPEGDNEKFDYDSFVDILEVLRERHGTMMVSYEQAPEKELELIRNLAKRFPDVRIIIGHSGDYYGKQYATLRDASTLADRTNVYLETSAMVSDAKRNLLGNVPPQKLFLGTGFPYKFYSGRDKCPLSSEEKRLRQALRDSLGILDVEREIQAIHENILMLA